MIVELYRYQWDIVWECENGGQLWGTVAEAGDPATTTMPNTICDPGWHTLFVIFIVALLVDRDHRRPLPRSPAPARASSAPAQRPGPVVVLALVLSDQAQGHLERPVWRGEWQVCEELASQSISYYLLFFYIFYTI